MYPHSANVLQAAGLRTIADCIAMRRANIAKTISDRRILKECREAQRRRGSPIRIVWWDQELDFVKEGKAGGGLGFVMRRSDDNQVYGRRNTMEDHHSRLRRQMAEEMGRKVAAPPPLRPPHGDAVPWHHRAGPVGGGLNIISAEEAAASRRAMPRILMPGESIPPY